MKKALFLVCVGAFLCADSAQLLGWGGKRGGQRSPSPTTENGVGPKGVQSEASQHLFAALQAAQDLEELVTPFNEEAFEAWYEQLFNTPEGDDSVAPQAPAAAQTAPAVNPITGLPEGIIAQRRAMLEAELAQLNRRS